MPVFAWEGRTRAGELKRGTLDATDEKSAASILRNQQITVSKLGKRGLQLKLPKLPFGGGVPTKVLVVFTRQFATMIDAGLPLVQCLEILASQTENKNFARVLSDVKAQVEGGSTFSEALRRHPKIFDELFVNLIAAGEIGGILDTILERLATHIEKAAALRRKVKGAMTYPIAIGLVAVGVVALMLGKVIPVFENMFKDFGAGSLPALTQTVVNLSRGFTKHFLPTTAVIVALSVGFTWSIRTRVGRKLFHAFQLKLPILGPTLRKIAVARFSRTLGTLLSSGVPILDALEIVAKTAGNVIVEAAIRYAREKISEGKDMATPLGETGVFPPMVVQMIGVGEQTGAMDTMLGKIADFYDDEVDVAVAAMTSLLEPMMMIVLGGIVGVLILSMYLPIFSMAGNIKAG